MNPSPGVIAYLWFVPPVAPGGRKCFITRMCGRYTAGKLVERVRKIMPLDEIQCELKPRYNIAPTQPAPVIINQGGTVLKDMRWGLIPFWAKDEGMGSQLINARSETVRDKPAFRHAFKRHRCLVVADSFYEWQKLPGNPRKQPMRILLRDESPFVFAGLWDTWKKSDGAELETFTIITCEANELMRPIHQRMPVIVKPEHYTMWLDPKNEDVDELAKILIPYPATAMTTHPVSTLVNNPKFDDPRCIELLTATSPGPGSNWFAPSEASAPGDCNH